jgi:orotidine-5'-phosphate decarboxylase
VARTVEIKLNTAATREAVHAASRRILAGLAGATGDAARHGAPRQSGFLASSVRAVAPGDGAKPGVSGQDGQEAAATPAAAINEAYVVVAASYALFAELRSPFLLPALQTAVDNLSALVLAQHLP